MSARVAQVMGEQAQHTLNKGLEAVMRAKLPDVLSDAPERKGPGARWRLGPQK